MKLLLITFCILYHIPITFQQLQQYKDFNYTVYSDSETSCWNANNNMQFYNCSTSTSSPCLCDLETPYSITFLILGGLALIGSITIIIGYIAFPELRAKPGDMVLGICISYALIAANYFITSIIDLTKISTIQSNNNYCTIVSFIELCSITASYLYSFGFCLYNQRTLKTGLKVEKTDIILPYVYIGLTILYGVFLLVFQSLLGMSISGTCSGKTSSAWNSYLSEIVLASIVGIFSLYTYFHIKKHLPDCNKINDKIEETLRYYFKYFIGSSMLCFMMIILLIFNIGVVSKVVLDSTNNGNASKGKIKQLKYIIQIFRLIAALLISTIRYFGPFIRQRMTKLFCFHIFKRNQSSGISANNSNNNTNNNTIIINSIIPGRIDSNPDINPGRNTVDSSTLSFYVQDEDSSNWLYELSHNLRVQVVYSILSGIIYFNINARETPLKDSKTKRLELRTARTEYYKHLAKQIRNYRINDDVILANLPELAEEIQQKEYKTLEGQLTIYAPQIFNEWIKNDELLINIEQSLDLKKNYSRIQRAGKAIGGKSGEFFFFSYDNKLIIKTITDEEASILVEILAKFAEYFNKNKNSLIAKIYGLFAYERAGTNKKLHLIVMRNINGFPNSYVERKYDLKGSSHDREVLKGQNLKLEDLKKINQTLKDQDFLKYEKKLDISPEDQQKLISVLDEDVDFLNSCGLIDYSLAVYVINKTKYYNRFESIPSNNPENQHVKSQQDSVLQQEVDTLPQYSDRSNKTELQILPNINNENNTNFLINNSMNSPSNNTVGHSSTKSLFNNQVIDPSLQNPLYSIKHTTEDFYYHIGIIDYLQLYNLQKKLERLSKKIANMDIRLDTSSQSPNTYATRFKTLIHKITLENLP